MGIIVSIPRIDGLTVSPLSITTSSTSYALSSPQASAFGVSTTIFDQYDTERSFGVTAPSTQTNWGWPPDVTDVTFVQSPTSPDSGAASTTYLSTATVISKIHSTQVFTTTATVEASNCLTTSITPSGASKSTVSTRGYPSSTVETPTHSTASIQQGTSSDNRPSGSVSVPSKSSFLISSIKSHKVSSKSVSNIETSILSSLITSDLKKESSGHSPVTTVQIKHPAHTTSIFHLGGGSLAVRSPVTAYNERDHTPSSSGRSIAATYLSNVIGTRNTSNTPGGIDLVSSTTLTDIKDVTTTTVYKSKIKHFTRTITTTIFPISCFISGRPTSTPTSSALCPSATPNPNPPANDTCAEDGLLEYSNTPQPPGTLEGCAVACLADTSCLSFTFIPSEGTCYTSLYPLKDSAFAGKQEYNISNYDRDCYSCSS